jgi:hypothetical protein
VGSSSSSSAMTAAEAAAVFVGGVEATAFPSVPYRSASEEDWLPVPPGEGSGWKCSNET